ncbi:MAG TPA: hypothetical protein PKE21_07075 [Flavobacteriales bacterium]|nr:hypothetical protein [Flavobacteriales bacterium]HMR27223.1 hypothetical protein [Flavobacteriales bacterium]
MTRHLLRTLVLGLTLGTVFLACAQEDDLPIAPERLQEVKAQRSAYLTQKMGLSPEESQRFWPVYNQYDKELEALRRERREGHRALRTDADLTDAEAAGHIDRELASQQQELDLRKRYSGEFIKLIGARKTLELHRAERDFNRELLRRMRERQGDRPGPPPQRR